MSRTSAAERLSEAHLAALRELPSYGFATGSNMWPLVCVGHSKIDGELFDELLRWGHIVATQLPEPILTDRTDDPEIAPDCECTHTLDLTPAGRRAISPHPADNASAAPSEEVKS